MVRGAYDLQRLRMQAGLRLCANFRTKLGQVSGESEDELEEKAKRVIDVLRESFVRLTDGIAKNRNLPAEKGFHGDEVISDYTELVLVSQYMSLESVERQQFRQLETILPKFPIYNLFLKNVVGVGPAMAAVIISEFDIHRAKYVSSLWAYAGLDVGPDGRGRSRRKEHLVKRAYVDKKGNDAVRDSITFNPFLKTKLRGVLAGSFLRKKSPYADVYRDYKHRIESDPRKQGVKDDGKPEWSKARINEAAKRYAVKMFLKDLYPIWRDLEGLEVHPPYGEGKLGMPPHSKPRGDRDGDGESSRIAAE